MKTHYYFTLVAAGLLGLAGCNTGFNPADTTEIVIRASVGNLSKVSYDGNATAFTSGDRLLLYAWMGSASVIPADKVVDGVVSTFDGNKWTPETKMLWKNMTGAHYFLGISPVPASVNGFTDVPYTIDPEDYTASDLLVATNLSGATGTDGPVKLQFDHVMAKLVVNLHFLNEWDKVPDVTSVTTVAKTEASVNYLTKAVTVKGDASNLAIPAAVSARPTGNILPFESIMVPQEGVRAITIVIDGKEYYFESATDIPLKANKYTALELAVGKEKIDLNSVSVSDWDSGTGFQGGEARMDTPTELVISVPVWDALFRGLESICLIPFSDVPGPDSDMISDSIMHPGDIDYLESHGIVNYRCITNQSLPVGSKHVLFYAKDTHYPGELTVSGLSDDGYGQPGGITFSPKQINTSSGEQAGNEVGGNIVKLLTDIANATVTGTNDNAFSNTTNSVLSALYSKFITTTVSSSFNLSVMLSRMYFALDHVQDTDTARPLADEIRTLIHDACAAGKEPEEDKPLSLKSDYAGYPGNIGLPDGAARIKWDNGRFVDEAAVYGQGLRVGLTDYVYPSTPWYFANSTLKASTYCESIRLYEAGSWAEVIGDIYADAADVVGDKTRSVAMTDPLRYAVGCLDVNIQMGEGPFFDREGKSVYTGSGYTLKGVLVSNQNSASWDFSPKGNENRVAYNASVPGGITAKEESTTQSVRTLVLQTEEKPTVVLELVNGGDDFMGSDGIIPAGGTFYLSAILDKPIKKGEVTSLTFTIENGTFQPTAPVGLGAAVNGIPDLY